MVLLPLVEEDGEELDLSKILVIDPRVLAADSDPVELLANLAAYGWLQLLTEDPPYAA